MMNSTRRFLAWHSSVSSLQRFWVLPLPTASICWVAPRSLRGPHDGVGAAIGELHVVVGVALGVGVADDVQLDDLGVVLEELGDVIEQIKGVFEDLVLVEGKINVAVDHEVVALDPNILGIRGGLGGGGLCDDRLRLFDGRGRRRGLAASEREHGEEEEGGAELLHCA